MRRKRQESECLLIPASLLNAVWEVVSPRYRRGDSEFARKTFACLLPAASPSRFFYPTRSLDVKEGCRRAKTSPCEAAAANCRLPATPPTFHTSTPGTD